MQDRSIEQPFQNMFCPRLNDLINCVVVEKMEEMEEMEESHTLNVHVAENSIPIPASFTSKLSKL